MALKLHTKLFVVSSAASHKKWSMSNTRWSKCKVPLKILAKVIKSICEADRGGTFFSEWCLKGFAVRSTCECDESTYISTLRKAKRILFFKGSIEFDVKNTPHLHCLLNSPRRGRRQTDIVIRKSNNTDKQQLLQIQAEEVS